PRENRRYFPRRSIRKICLPTIRSRNAASVCSFSTFAFATTVPVMQRPDTSFSKPRRNVSTSGNSGTIPRPLCFRRACRHTFPFGNGDIVPEGMLPVKGIRGRTRRKYGYCNQFVSVHKRKFSSILYGHRARQEKLAK